MKKISLLILILISIVPISAEIKAAENKKIFIIASYEKNHVCGGPQEQGAIKGLSKEGWFAGMNLEVAKYYMDTKRKNTTPELMKKEAEKALKQIQAFGPDVVITLDDNAFREVGLSLRGRNDLAVVFSGMNGQPKTYNADKHFMNSRNQPGGNITGVSHRHNLEIR